MNICQMSHNKNNKEYSIINRNCSDPKEESAIHGISHHLGVVKGNALYMDWISKMLTTYFFLISALKEQSHEGYEVQSRQYCWHEDWGVTYDNNQSYIASTTFQHKECYGLLPLLKKCYGGVTCGVAIVERMLWGVTYGNNQSYVASTTLQHCWKNVITLHLKVCINTIVKFMVF